MYRTIVRRRIRGTFLNELSAGDYAAVVGRTAGDVVHVFPGEGALGGTRTSQDALRRMVRAPLPPVSRAPLRGATRSP